MNFAEKNSVYVKEFDRYILEYPEIADKIPQNALVVMQIMGDEDFNNWARQTAKDVAEENQSIVYVKITELKPVRSRIESLELEFVNH
jgi:hypothetical protein